MGSQDLSLRQQIAITSIPSGFISYLFAASLPMPANSSATVTVFNIPNTPVLNLWNFGVSILIDGTNIAQCIYPSGSNFTNAFISTISFTQWVDYFESDDALGVASHRLHLFNGSPNQHTFNVYYKAYNLATTTGGQGGQP